MAKKKLLTLRLTEIDTVDVVSHIACHRLSNGYGTSSHNHDFAELFWGVKGMAYHEFNGQLSTTGERELWLIRPHDIHNVYVKHDGCYTFNNLGFPKSILDEFSKRYESPILRSWCSSDDKCVLRFHLSSVLFQWLNVKVQDLFCNRTNRMTLDFFLINLLYELEKQEKTPFPENCPEWLTKVCRKVSKPEYFSQGPDVFAVLSGYSQAHVARELKKYIGKTPTEMINEAKLQHAAMLLATSMERICDISYTCGFQSISYFFSSFKRRFGLTPLNYRNKNKIFR